ncbi:MAG: hypothetical protein IMZ64_12985 [Bacteroidetes bacterium]|nr:hypothetical protein [Bacteroidota bacterium]
MTFNPAVLAAYRMYDIYYRAKVCPKCSADQKIKRRCHTCDDKPTLYCDHAVKARTAYLGEFVMAEIMQRWIGAKIGMGKVVTSSEVFCVKDDLNERFHKRVSKMQDFLKKKGLIEESIMILVREKD